MIENENTPTTPRPITSTEDNQAATIHNSTPTKTENTDDVTVVHAHGTPGKKEPETSSDEVPESAATTIEHPATESSTNNVPLVQQDSETKATETSQSTPTL